MTIPSAEPAVDPTAHARRGGLTRVTLVGPRRRVDLVLPSDEPLGVLLPEIVRLTGHQLSGVPRGHQLSLLDGRVVGPVDTLRAAGVADGSLIRVDTIAEAPPAVVVHDVTDEVADDLDRRPGRWGEVPRRWTATGVTVLTAALATVLAAGRVPGAVLVGVGVLLLVGGTVVAAAGRRPVGVAVLLAGAAVVATAQPQLLGGGLARWAGWIALSGVVIFALGVACGWLRAAAMGAGAVLALLGLWVGLARSGVPVDRTATVLAVVSTLLLGVLPRLAVVASGLTRLDDRQTEGQPALRVAVDAAVDSAHRGIALATVAASVSAAVAGWLLAAAATSWTTALSCLVALAMVLRLRAYPLVAEVVALVAGSVAVLVGLVSRWVQAEPSAWPGGLACYVAVALVALVILVYEPRAHVQARVRRLADRIEAATVTALVPVAVGVFGVYARLLSAF